MVVQKAVFFYNHIILTQGGVFMKKQHKVIDVHRALRKAEAELRLEGCPTPAWGKDIFARVQNKSITMDAAHSEIKQYIAKHLAMR